ncbi:MAG TPA: hypothetical protein VF267_12410 [Gammaproteobacteria bacterium]
MNRDSKDRRLASHAGKKNHTLHKRIEDMEARLAVERSQVIAHAREYGGTVRRRLTSPTSLLFATSMGFVAAELIRARSVASKRRGRTKAQRKTAGKSTLEILMKPAMALLHLMPMGILFKQQDSVAKAAQADMTGAAEEDVIPPVLH